MKFDKILSPPFETIHYLLHYKIFFPLLFVEVYSKRLVYYTVETVESEIFLQASMYHLSTSNDKNNDSSVTFSHSASYKIEDYISYHGNDKLIKNAYL